MSYEEFEFLGNEEIDICDTKQKKKINKKFCMYTSVCYNIKQFY